MKSKTPKIVVLDAYSINPGDISWHQIESLGKVQFFDRSSPNEVVPRASDADVILTNKVKINADIINKLQNLKYIGVMATGYDVVDVNAAKSKGIIVTNAPAYSTNHVAQLVFAHLLNIVDRVEAFACDNRTGRWSASNDFCYWDEPTHELASMTMGIIGLGNIGQTVAKIAQSFGMRVSAVTSKKEQELPAGIKKETLDNLLAESDVISLHCPLNDSTRYIINRESIKKMKSSAIVINTGRGPLVNDDDMADALSKKTIKAYAADVITEEPPRSDNPLLPLQNAYFTPHIAWASQEARIRLIEILAKNIEAFFKGKPLNVVS